MMGSLPSLAALSFPARRSSDLVGVDEVRGRPGVGDGIGSRCECHRRGGNDVAGADSPGQQTEVEGSGAGAQGDRSEEHTSELQSRGQLVCRVLLERQKRKMVKE